MRNILTVCIVISAMLLYSETLFEVKDASNNKVLDISTDGLRVLNGGDTLMVISTDGIRAYIQRDSSKGLSRSFSVTTTSSVKSSDTKSQSKVFEIATDEGATFYNPSDNSDEIFSISKTGITANVNPTLNRDFQVNDQISANKAGSGNLMKISNEEIFETVNDSTMLWYKQKNAFRVGHVLITDPDSVGQASFASGYQSQASGKYASAIGYMSVASGDNSFASGTESVSGGSNSFAIGYKAEATGSPSFSIGNVSKATGNSSFSMGVGCTASGGNSIAFGSLFTEASGDLSTAIGFGSKAEGWYSTAIGQGVRATGDFSTAMNIMTTSQAYNSFVIGRYNKLEGDLTTWVDTDPLFVVGNGSADYTRSNAFEVKKNGNTLVSGTLSVYDEVYVKGDEAIWSDGSYFRWGNGGIGNYFPDKVGLGITAPERKLHIVETSAVPAALIQNTGGTDAYFALQAGNTSNVNRWDLLAGTDGSFRILDKNANVSRLRIYSNGSIYAPGTYNYAVGTTNRDLFVDSSGYIGYVSSSVRYKENISQMEDVSWLYELNPVNYNYKSDASKSKQYGLVAEEVDKINKLFVSYNENGEVETVSYSNLITPMLKALQDQKEMIEALQKEIEELKKR
ncbi:MAG: tail fiber domain-containing protein [Candidatus Delongbacteria bacterium]|nr:tail fiber domain-containing protein [Candidatus Delongbacteria bacterium]MDD4205776.1 tail fiber domain-containing protein [Candidatus Delongbacteria bacterium]MDY0016491.1 tail fiber domain-containing protein [Candidatus Delongbacteria bacterium]